ncbi:MAG TPA: pseudouridine synthase [Clostridia bacterium]|nr:pseudouridine synthase [Clostridia bacterium]
MRKTQRLDKVLSNFGFGTRSELRRVIKDGLVKVDGVVVNDASMHVDPENSRIEVEGKLLNYRQFVYVMMNKPAGVISATYDPKLKTAIELLPQELACFDLFPAGRLDIDTEGMLLLTNDGQLAHNLLSPVKHVDKRYYALIDGVVTRADVDSFKAGVILDDGYKTMPAELEIIDAFDKSGTEARHGGLTLTAEAEPAGDNNRSGRSEIEVVLHEGKFHQVKRMFEAVDKKVIYLKRIQMGGLKLDESLKPGECRELLPEEVQLLKG